MRQSSIHHFPFACNPKGQSPAIAQQQSSVKRKLIQMSYCFFFQLRTSNIISSSLSRIYGKSRGSEKPLFFPGVRRQRGSIWLGQDTITLYPSRGRVVYIAPSQTISRAAQSKESHLNDTLTTRETHREHSKKQKIIICLNQRQEERREKRDLTGQSCSNEREYKKKRKKDLICVFHERGN